MTVLPLLKEGASPDKGLARLRLPTMPMVSCDILSPRSTTRVSATSPGARPTSMPVGQRFVVPLMFYPPEDFPGGTGNTKFSKNRVSHDTRRCKEHPWGTSQQDSESCRSREYSDLFSGKDGASPVA